MAKPRPLHLALQGGGSHGALAWGVIDRLLDEPSLQIKEISGASAGAMNAVVLAAGLAKGGRQAAKEALERFWRRVSEAACFSPVQPSPWERLWGIHSLDNSPSYLMMETLSRVFSPYEMNPIGVNPLLQLITQEVDFDLLNAGKGPRVHVSATNVRTGRARVFSSGALSAQALMASACLPQMYQAVEIDGEAYWDGGFSANPALYPLLSGGEGVDLLIVQLNPMTREELPRSARDIINRVNEISFNTSLIKELRSLDLLRRLAAEGRVTLSGDIRLHMIHCAQDLQGLSASSKLNADWEYLQRLFEQGRRWAEMWLEASGKHLGRQSSLDLDEMFGP